MDETDRKIMRLLRNSEDGLSSREITYLLKLLGNKENQDELNEIIKILKDKEIYKEIEKRFEKAKEKFNQMNREAILSSNESQSDFLKNWSFEINKSNLIRHLKYLEEDGKVLYITRGSYGYWEIERFPDLEVIENELKDENSTERLFATKKLIIRNRRQDVEILGKYFKKETDTNVKHWQALWLGIVGGSEAVKKLISAMGEKEGFVRLGVTEALKMQGEGISNKIKEQLNSSKNNTVRLSALEVLFVIGKDDSEMIPILEKLKNDPDKKIRKISTKYAISHRKSINKK